MQDQLHIAASKNIKEKEYWLNRFSGELEKSTFPTDFGMKQKPSHPQRQSMPFKLEGELFSHIMNLSNNYDYTLFIILAAGLKLLLHKYTGSDDIILAAPIYKQEGKGDFINTVLPLRSRIQDRMTFKDLLLQLKNTLVEADQHQNYPLFLLLDHLGKDRNDKNFSLFDTAVLLENIHDKDYLRHIPLNILFVFRRSDDAILAALEYDPLLYRKESIKGLITRYLHLLRQSIRRTNIPLAEIRVLTGDEKKQILEDFNNTAAHYPHHKTIDQLVEEQVEKTPRQMALIYRDRQLTYKELNRQGRQLAARLRGEGITPDTIVGIMADRSLEMITGLLGILMAGAAYLPVSPLYPDARKQYMIADANIKLLLTTGTMKENYRARIIHLKAQKNNLPPPTTDRHHKPGNLAYVMYTSGSTGKPKGVLVNHRSVLRLVKNTNYITFTREDRILQTGALEFDASTFEIWGALLNGLPLCMVNARQILTPDKLETAIEKHKVTTLWLTSPLFNQLVDTGGKLFPGVKNLLVGGDIVSPFYVEKVKKQYPSLNIINGYGPTENTTFSTTYPIRGLPGENMEKIPIGAPIANSSVYIIDKNNQLCPPNIVGEICVGGDGLSRGYLNNPELTAEKFVLKRLNHQAPRGKNLHDAPSALNSTLYACLYRTGDLGRWLSDGNIQFAGRCDHQVKIRGFRVELEEINHCLLCHPQIKESVVMTRPDENGDKSLCAFIVPHTPGKPLNASIIEEYLDKILPGYMIPDHFIPLTEMPLTANGKINRKHLAQKKINALSDTPYTAPGNQLEEKLQKIWEKVLGLEKISVHQPFARAGGNSLKALQIVNAVHKTYKTKIDIRDLFSETSTIAGLSHVIRSSKTGNYPEIEKTPHKEYYPLSYAQERLWLLSKFEPHSPAFNMTGKITLHETVKEYQVNQVLEQLSRRHESFSTGFREIEGHPVQFIESGVAINLESMDISHLPPGEREKERLQILRTETFIPFELEKPPLVRVKLIKCKPDEYDLLFTLSHLVSDGWSMIILEREFFRLYDACKNGTTCQLEPLRIQYKDYAQWEGQLLADKESTGAAKQYWKNQLDGGIRLLNLPYDYPPGKLSTKSSAAYRTVVPAQVTEKLRNLADDRGATLFMILLAAGTLFLSQITGQKDIAVAIPGAARQHDDLKYLIGMFVNTLILRNRIQPGETFGQFLEKVRDNTFHALEYQQYPMELICSQLNIKYPEINVFFNMPNLGDTHRENLRNLDTFHQTEVLDAKFQLVFYLMEYKNAIHIGCHYFKELFSPLTIEKICLKYVRILQRIAGNPHQTIDKYKGAASRLERRVK